MKKTVSKKWRKATFPSFSDLASRFAPGRPSPQSKKTSGFHPFRRTRRRSRIELKGLRPLNNPGACRRSGRFLSVLLAALLALSLCSAFAFTVTFNGQTEGFDFQPGSEYTATDLFSFKNVMPGDTLEQTITFTNDATDSAFVNLYLRAVPHDDENTLSDGVAATETVESMTDFLSQLSLEVWKGTEQIYASSPDEPAQLTENTFLGTYRGGETVTLTVKLIVPLTLDNRYANRIGEVDWVFHVEAYEESKITVRKVWSDGNAKHAGESVSVTLYMDGEATDRTAVLNADNGWVYVFDRLVEGHEWTVEEDKVPACYVVSYDTVEDGEEIADASGYVPRGVITTVLNEQNLVDPQVFPFDDEAADTEEGTDEIALSDDETVLLPLDITVQKVWSGDEAADRPAYVTVTLYDGADEYDTIRLSDENGWSYHWSDADALGNWQVVETNLPKGYVPSYSVQDDTVTITNTKTLVQTGQENWLICVLCGAGILLIIFVLWILLKKRKKEA